MSNQTKKNRVNDTKRGPEPSQLKGTGGKRSKNKIDLTNRTSNGEVVNTPNATIGALNNLPSGSTPPNPSLSLKKRERVAGRPRGFHRPIVYPWGAWFAKRIFTLHSGVDYHCQTHCMSLMVRQQAPNYGASVSIRTGPDKECITVTVTKKAD